MTQKIIYGTVTKSIEDFSQCIVVLLDEELDYEELEERLNDWDTDEGLTFEDLTTWQHVLSILPVLLAKENVPQEQSTKILAAVMIAAMDDIDKKEGR